MGGRGYGLSDLGSGDTIDAPELPYRPRDPEAYRPLIALVGCGGIAESHLSAYRDAGYEVAALVDPTVERARERAREFYPDARVLGDHRELLEDERIEVVDVATHPDVRPTIVEDCLRAGKHVLSQKPFVLDLDEGARLVAIADEVGRRLAVNQNGRWAPHLAWARTAVERGLLGDLACVDVTIHWDHSWVIGTKFDETEHLVLFDFGVHWFDLVRTLFGDRRPRRVTATEARAPEQAARQPLVAHAAVDFEDGRATLAFHGASRHFQLDSTTIAGSLATVHSRGPDLQTQELVYQNANGSSRPELEGRWFDDGFHGAMAELLCAIEEEREPCHSARDNLATLELAFAACESARSGAPVEIGEVRRLPLSGT